MKAKFINFNGIKCNVMVTRTNSVLNIVHCSQRTSHAFIVTSSIKHDHASVFVRKFSATSQFVETLEKPCQEGLQANTQNITTQLHDHDRLIMCLVRQASFGHIADQPKTTQFLFRGSLQRIPDIYEGLTSASMRLVSVPLEAGYDRTLRCCHRYASFSS